MAKNKRCLVLGANGFIGSHLVDKLSSSGYEIVAFDRFSRPAEFIDKDNISITQGDIFDISDVAAALSEIDVVFHCFSATTPYSAEIDPYSDITQNILNNVKIFELCVKQKVSKIVYVSSGGAIYGSELQNDGGAEEDDSALPISPYGIGKLATERYLAYFSRKYNTKVISYRLSNPYGPRQITKHNQGVIPRFIESIQEKKKISVYGDGSSSRDYIYISDAVEFIARSFEHASKELYNIGSGEQTSIINIIRLIEIYCNQKAEIEYIDEPATYSRSTKINTRRFTEEFNLKTKVNLDTGLNKTIAYMKQRKP